MNKNKCADQSGCIYSKSMNQPHPRLCIKCGHPEESAIDLEKYTASKTREITIEEIALALNWMHQRNHYVRHLGLPGLEECNKNIKKILQLT